MKGLRVAGCELRVTDLGRWASQLATRNSQLLLALLIMLAAQAAHACPTCYGDPDSPLTKGSDNAILFMLGVIGFVQIGFIGLFVTFWRRARALRHRRESLRVIDGGAR
jgi:hypothetical protein